MIDAPVLIDSGPLSKLVHPRVNKDITEWVKALLNSGATIILPEICDYEVRRNLILSELSTSLERLEQLKSVIEYLPIDTATMLKAAEFWAHARKNHKQTASDKALDADVILAAQAFQVGGIIATENIGHLALFVRAKRWQDIS